MQWLGAVGLQEGPGRIPKLVFGVPDGSQGALGMVVQVNGGPFGGLLDLQARVCQRFDFETNPVRCLMASFFALNDFWKVPSERVLGVCSGSKATPKDPRDDDAAHFGRPWTGGC